VRYLFVFVFVLLSVLISARLWQIPRPSFDFPVRFFRRLFHVKHWGRRGSVVNGIAFNGISVLLYMPAVRAVLPCGCIPAVGWREGAAVVGKNYNCISPFLVVSCCVLSCLVVAVAVVVLL
jgi:hypothetical protein